MTTAIRLWTADELWKLPRDGRRRELVKGELRTMAPAGFDHGVVTMDLGRLLANHVRANQLGLVTGAETGFRLRPDPDTVRGADIAFVSAARVQAVGRPAAFWPGAPDLAVEVLSPGDTVFEVEEKVEDYLAAGCRLVWVVNPRRRVVLVYRPGAEPVTLSEQEPLDGTEVVPGFQVQVSAIFA